ncbi:MAG: nucleoside-diphosphate-sugar epimerase [Alcanivorax sp.]|jgi:nucleoside-diphosphate-sugar epimerase
MTKVVLILGAGGFIGGHLARRLHTEGSWVRGVDIKQHEHQVLPIDEFVVGDLRDAGTVSQVFDRQFDEVYQLAADMGGAGYLFTGENDADVMHNSVQINLNVLQACVQTSAKKVFYSSSACIYPEHNQMDPSNPNLAEDSAYPAAPDSEYGWEKLFSERLYATYRRNHGLDCRIGRFHNIYGDYGTWEGGKEKVPAAVCRKVAQAQDGDAIEIWGDGLQTRSFLFVEECVEAVTRLMASNCIEPLNIGSDEMISINDLARMVIGLSEKRLSIKNVDGPTGVRGRTSDNRLIEQKLGWRPSRPLIEGLEQTYRWINSVAHDSLPVG